MKRNAEIKLDVSKQIANKVGQVEAKETGAELRNEIRRVYNQVAALYNRDRVNLHGQRLLRFFIEALPKQASVLDLGCGSGVPVAETLLRKGFLVTGLDFSETQIQLARKNCPRGAFFLRDVATLQPAEFSVDAVVCLYTLFHLPRQRHAEFLKILASFLPIAGMALLSFGEKNFEGWHDFYGQRIWSSQFGPKTNRELLSAAGFVIVEEMMNHSAHEEHWLVLAKKER
jgi:2-polyprenyl-3-methyl-5-hydroxy-6-metoxy-1,4-benzoquinol methylase